MRMSSLLYKGIDLLCCVSSVIGDFEGLHGTSERLGREDAICTCLWFPTIGFE